jgi:carboxylesterase type B
MAVNGPMKEAGAFLRIHLCSMSCGTESLLAFARTGNPNAPGLAYWPLFDSKYQPMMMFNVNSRAVTDPIRGVRLLLERASQASACK